MDLVAVVSNFCTLMTLEAHSREDEWKDKETETNNMKKLMDSWCYVWHLKRFILAWWGFLLF